MDQPLQQIHLVIDYNQYRRIEMALYNSIQIHEIAHARVIKTFGGHPSSFDHPALAQLLHYEDQMQKCIELINFLNNQSPLHHGPAITANSFSN